MKYTNETHNKGKSSFIKVDPVSGQTVSFAATQKRFTIAGISGKATNAQVRLVIPTTLSSDCDPCQLGVAESTFDIRFNLVAGQDFPALRDEAIRLLNVAVQGYFLDGVVPGPNANLDSE